MGHLQRRRYEWTFNKTQWIKVRKHSWEWKNRVFKRPKKSGWCIQVRTNLCITGVSEEETLNRVELYLNV